MLNNKDINRHEIIIMKLNRHEINIFNNLNQFFYKIIYNNN